MALDLSLLAVIEAVLAGCHPCQSCAKATVRNVVVTTALSSKPAKLAHASATKVPAVMAKLWRTMATHCGRPRIASFGLRGGRLRTSGSPSLIASAKAGNTSVMRFR